MTTQPQLQDVPHQVQLPEFIEQPIARRRITRDDGARLDMPSFLLGLTLALVITVVLGWVGGLVTLCMIYCKGA